MTVLTQIMFLLLGIFGGWKAKGYVEKIKLKKGKDGFVIPKSMVVLGSVIIVIVIIIGVVLSI